ncbi:hypothetical protein YC2023_098525 [Brassica napus]
MALFMVKLGGFPPLWSTKALGFSSPLDCICEVILPHISLQSISQNKYDMTTEIDDMTSVKYILELDPRLRADDGEVNEDASKKPVKVTKKRGRGNKDGEMNEDAYKKPVKVTKKRGRGNKVNISMYNGMKKGVTPPREVQQQVEDDAEVDAKDSENPETNGDGEMNNDASKKPVKVTKKRGRGNKDREVNEDASNKPVKFTKKRGRGNKEPNVDTSKSKRQKKQEDSAGDVIGRVLEDLEKTD